MTLAMLEDVLDACLPIRGWEVWVVSRSEEVLAVAARRGATPTRERGRSLLEALGQVEGSLPPRTTALAVVLADLPLVTTEAVSRALAHRAAVVAAPAASDGGTNMLVRRPPRVIPARFGRASFARHRWAADRAGARFRVIRGMALGFDLDRPDDLAVLARADHPGRATDLCLALGVADRLAGVAG
jgi:2-phospho-L-lactate guanylyltransferase